MVAGLVDRSLKLIAELGQPLEPLLVGQSLRQRVLYRHVNVSTFWDGLRGTSYRDRANGIPPKRSIIPATLGVMRGTAVSVVMATMIVAAVFAAEPVSRRDAARLQAKIERITNNPGTRNRTAAQTPITETEVNSYLQYELSDRMPAGIKDPWVSILDNGRLSGKATVDLGRVAQSRKSGGMLDPFSYLTGTVPVLVNGVLRTKSGTATFALESASVSGVPIPAWMLQEIVSYYSKSETAPEGVSIDKPFALPSGIREIQLARGQAVVVQ